MARKTVHHYNKESLLGPCKVQVWHDLGNEDSIPPHVIEQINDLGNQSASAQGLQLPITSFDKSKKSIDAQQQLNNQTIYTLTILNNEKEQLKKETVLGFLKVGCRDLYLYNKENVQIRRNNVPCVMDFFVLEHYQRLGIGQILFETMLQTNKTGASHAFSLAYDRPSKKLIRFLEKHYNTIDHEIQPNRFALFNGFWK